MKNLFTLLLVGTLLSAPAMAKNNRDTSTCLDLLENVNDCFVQNCINNTSCNKDCIINSDNNQSSDFLSNLLQNLNSGNISTGWNDIINSHLLGCFPDINLKPVPPEHQDTPENIPDSSPDCSPENSPVVPENTPDKPSDTPSQDTETPNSNFVSEIIRLVNIERNKAGLSSVKESRSLNSAALIRAKETVSLFSHTRPNGTSCFTVLAELGIPYNGAGENIAMGQTSPQQVMNEWMNSAGHRANILNSSFENLGVGVYKSGGRYYWAQMFTY